MFKSGNGSATTITCSFCGMVCAIRKFQRHLHGCASRPECGDGERICTFCQIKQPIDAFVNAGVKLDYRCKACNIVISRDWYHGNRGRAREQMIRWRFGITGEEYAARFTAQGGVCAICGKPSEVDGAYNKRNLAIDHDHLTGAVRGLLCHHCNNGLGCFKDSIPSLLQAIDYLKAHAANLVP